MPAPLGLPPDISKIAGPLLVDYLLQWGLFGALSVQVYTYYLAFPNDLPSRKILVYAVYAAELTQTILYTKTAFKELAVGYGSFEALSEIGNAWFAMPIMSSIVAFVVQIFYAYRIRLLAKSNSIAIVVVSVALVQLGGGIAEGAIVHRLPLLSEIVNGKTLIISIVWSVGSAVCDVIIAVAMTYYLSRYKSTRKPTQRITQRLIFLIIGSGTLTATVAMISLILFLLPGHPLYFSSTIGILGKVYSTTMMVVLNNRIVIRTQDESITLDEPLVFSMSNPGITSSTSA